jgi:hypothetical protein
MRQIRQRMTLPAVGDIVLPKILPQFPKHGNQDKIYAEASGALRKAGKWQTVDFILARRLTRDVVGLMVFLVSHYLPDLGDSGSRVLEQDAGEHRNAEVLIVVERLQAGVALAMSDQPLLP